MRVAICDDNPVQMLAVSKKIKSAFEKRNPENKYDLSIKEFTRTNDILSEHEKIQFDVAFLDVDMPGLSGFQVADLMYALNPRMKIIYVTSYGKYIKESINHEVFYFIAKGCDDDYQEAIDKILREYDDCHRKVHFEIIPDDETDVYNIMYFTAGRNCVIAHTKTREIRLRTTIAEVEKLYRENYCFRADRSTVVNFYYVYNIIDRDINMQDGTKLRASRERAKELRKLHYLYTFDRDSLFDDNLLYFSPDLDDKPLTADEMRGELKASGELQPVKRRWWQI